MSENHKVTEPFVINDDLRELLWSMTRYIAESEFEDLIQRCVEENWELKDAESHIAWQGLVLEWYLNNCEYPNPTRYALAEIKKCANESMYADLHPSLKFQEHA